MDKKLHDLVMNRDKVCVNCKSDSYLDVHHIVEETPNKTINAYEDERPENLAVLCHDCHMKIHKGNRVKRLQVRNAIMDKIGGPKVKCSMHRWQFLDGRTICIRCGEVR